MERYLASSIAAMTSDDFAGTTFKGRGAPPFNRG
jgi:hypothetical protein